MVMHITVLEVVPYTLLMYHAQVVRPACSSVTVTQYCLVAVHTQGTLELSVKVGKNHGNYLYSWAFVGFINKPSYSLFIDQCNSYLFVLTQLLFSICLNYQCFTQNTSVFTMLYSTRFFPKQIGTVVMLNNLPFLQLHVLMDS